MRGPWRPGHGLSSHLPGEAPAAVPSALCTGVATRGWTGRRAGGPGVGSGPWASEPSGFTFLAWVSLSSKWRERRNLPRSVFLGTERSSEAAPVAGVRVPGHRLEHQPVNLHNGSSVAKAHCGGGKTTM